MNFTEIQNLINKLQSENQELKTRLDKLEKTTTLHQHTNLDGSPWLDNTDIFLRNNKAIVSGCAGIVGQTTLSTSPSSPDTYTGVFVTGQEANRQSGTVGSQTKDAEVFLQKTKDSPDAFLYGMHDITLIDCSSKVFSVTSGQTIIVDGALNLGDTSLTGYFLITKYKESTSGGFTDYAYLITSTTNNTITLATPILYTGLLSSYFVSASIYLGSSNMPWRRLYASMNTTGGLRFGLGQTNNGQNTLLYDNGTNTLIYRNLSGTSFYLPMSTGGVGGSGSSGAGKQFIAINVNGTTYKVLHDGTI